MRLAQGDWLLRPPAPRGSARGDFLGNALLERLADGTAPGPAPHRAARPPSGHFGCRTSSRWPVFSPQKRPAKWRALDGSGNMLLPGGPEGGRARELRVAHPGC